VNQTIRGVRFGGHVLHHRDMCSERRRRVGKSRGAGLMSKGFRGRRLYDYSGRGGFGEGRGFH